MVPPLSPLSRQRARKERETFRKCKKTLLKNCNNLEQSCGAKVYLLVYRKGKYFSYVTEVEEKNETGDVPFPPGDEYLKDIRPPVQVLTSSDFEPLYEDDVEDHEKRGNSGGSGGHDQQRDEAEKIDYMPQVDSWYQSLPDEKARSLKQAEESGIKSAEALAVASGEGALDDEMIDLRRQAVTTSEQGTAPIGDENALADPDSHRAPMSETRFFDTEPVRDEWFDSFMKVMDEEDERARGGLQPRSMSGATCTLKASGEEKRPRDEEREELAGIIIIPKLKKLKW